MPIDPLTTITIGSTVLGGLGGLFGGGKKPDIPLFSDTLAEFRKKAAGEIGLSREQVAQILGVGTKGITREREIAQTRRLDRLENAGLGDSVAAANTSLIGGAQAQQRFGELAISIGSLQEQAKVADEARIFREAATAQGLELQRIQLAEGIETSQQNRFQSFIDQFVDPLESFALLQELNAIEDLFQGQGSFNDGQATDQAALRFSRATQGETG